MRLVLYLITVRRVKLEAGEVAGINWLGQVTGTETSPDRRPCDDDAMTFIPDRVNPRKCAKFTSLGEESYSFIIDFLLRNNLVPPPLTPSCLESFCRFYHQFLYQSDKAYRKLHTPGM